MLVDEMTIRLTGGNGGAGRAAFNKVKLMQGPSGGDGGHGGNIYLEGIVDIGALAMYSNKKEIKADNGKNGGSSFTDGHRGEDLILTVPIGTMVTNLDTGYIDEVIKVGQRILVAGGGIGGRGNYKFRSSTNTTPLEFEKGKTGDSALYKLSLKLIADVGLIGLPNAGKSSLLNELTSSRAKVANYPFTTLEPNLGSYFGTIIADIPGLIEGASDGKGLGVKFLKHIERTDTFFHLVSCESDDVVRDYKTIRHELEAYDPALTKKHEVVFLTKSDMATPKELKEKLDALKKIKVKAIPFSILEPESLEVVKKELNAIRDNK
ncbi:MAG TPA: Obg family GTPase CgtA [Candidatus Paceibacterota bacterium]|nr:Obg family GTPase CgtA [Candidatus Paceibacterota bacterium]